MELSEYRLSYRSKKDHIHIIPLGDIHLGSVGCDKEHLKKIIDYIKGNDHAWWVGMGDYIEAINPIDPRFDPRSIDTEYDIKDLSRLVQRQVEDILNLLCPIGNKCMGLLTGNHEETIRLRYYTDATLDLCRALKTTYLGYDAFIRLICTRKVKNSIGDAYAFTIYASHGWGSSRKSGAKVLRLEDFAHNFDANIILIGHEHKKIIAPPVMRLGISRVDTLRLESHKQIACMTGSFLKGYVPSAMMYVEKAGYNPSDLGVIKITIEPHKRNIHASL